MLSQAQAPPLDQARPRAARVLRPVEVDAGADAARMLVALHERVERQFEAYEAAEGAVAGRHDPEIERQLQQDHLLDLVMVELGAMVPSDRGYDAKVRVLMQVFRQHARDAEDLLLPELRRRLGPAERELLGRRVLERVGQLEGRPRPGW